MDTTKFYIDGQWVDPVRPKFLEVINPATELPCATISLGCQADVDRAVKAAKRAFETWGCILSSERLGLLSRLADIYEQRIDEMARTISLEMGAPVAMARSAQAPAGLGHLRDFIKSMEDFRWEAELSDKEEGCRILHEPIGVAALITPWNWPMNQVALKVGAALAAGCTTVLKPSEIAPLSSLLFAEFVDQAGFPPGVFNLVNGDGPDVGAELCAHPDVDVVSLTGSARAGIAATRAAAASIKRVSLELGGKGPNLVFADADVEKAVRQGTRHVFRNSGQSCNAPTRMLVERPIYDRAVEIARSVAEATKVGDPQEDGTHIGPVASKAQFDKIQALIQSGIDEGARLVAGGIGRPENVQRGYFVKPTVFAGVDNSMTIAREEIFGPVLAILPFDSEEDGVRIANDTPYGLAAYLQTGDADRGRRLSRQLRSGMVHINGTDLPFGAPFGGYKQSGNGREGGIWGVQEFLEVKGVSGWL